MQSAKIVVKNLYKVFGGKSSDVMRMLKSGTHKDEIFKQTGSVVGVNDVSFSAGG
jgi:glycine betaine/proline transport system ATP-binding protein